MITNTGAARLVSYGVGLVSFGAVVAQMYGLADYDPKTGMIDIRPFNVNAIMPALLALGNQALAVVAVVKGWKTWH